VYQLEQVVALQEGKMLQQKRHKIEPGTKWSPAWLEGRPSSVRKKNIEFSQFFTVFHVQIATSKSIPLPDSMDSMDSMDRSPASIVDICQAQSKVYMTQFHAKHHKTNPVLNAVQTVKLINFSKSCFCKLMITRKKMTVDSVVLTFF
jgi:hypothetical protein